MSTSSTPNSYRLLMEHYMNASVPSSKPVWVDLSQIEIPADIDSSFYLGAESSITVSPNWEQTFARRGKRYEDYTLVDVLVDDSVILKSKRLYLFDSYDGDTRVTLAWPFFLTGPLQGDVVVSRRSALKVPATHLRTISLELPEDYAPNFVEARYVADFSIIEKIALMTEDPQANKRLAALRFEWQPSSFVCTRRVLRSELVDPPVPST